MVGLQSFCSAGQRRRWLCIKENLGIITKVCHSKPKSVDEVNLMGELCTWKVLSKISFWKNCLLLQKQKVTVLELIGQRVAAWHSSSCAPLCLGTLALSLPTPALAAELGVFFGENLSRIWPAESYHLHLPLCPCCESPVNDHTTGRASPSHTSAGFGTAMLCKDASKEAQTGGWCRLGHRTVGQALRKKLSPHIRKGGTALSNLKKCKDKLILKSQRNSSLLNLIFNTYSTCKVSVVVRVCAWEIWGATKERNTLFQSGVFLHGTPDPFSCFQEMPRKSRASITMKKVQPSSIHKQQVLPELNEGREVWQVYKHHSEKGSCSQENLNYFKILVPLKNYMVVYTRKNTPVLLFK